MEAREMNFELRDLQEVPNWKWLNNNFKILAIAHLLMLESNLVPFGLIYKT